jgi:DsbC/DsbD-like thiol-disulfide interchange protein
MASVFLSGSAAQAQDASAWHREAHAAARLIAGTMVKTPSATFLRAGIEIELDPGWKTYWRNPGDSGVPPTFDFAGSDNVKSAIVLWPAPERFPDDAGGNSIGYLGHIILPLRITPADATRKSSVHLKLDYAICGTLCVPAEAKLDLSLNGKGDEETTLEKAELLVPRRVALGADDHSGLAIRSVHREPGGEHERVVVELAAPAGASVDLFVEGPTPDWSLPLPEQSGPPAPVRRFTFDLDGLPPGAQAQGAALTFTVVSGDTAIEVLTHLD